MSAENRLEQISQQGYDIDFGEIFNRSFENYKQIALNGGLVLLLLTVVICGGLFAVMSIIWGASALGENLVGLRLGDTSVLFMSLYIIALVVFSGLAAPINAGFLKMAHHASRGLDFSVGTVFDYYKSAYFKDLFTATALITFFSIGISTIIDSFGMPMFGALFNYIVSFFTFFTIPLIIFGDLKPVAAIKGSVMLVSKQFFILLGLMLVCIILVMLGLFGFCIGIFFTLPLLYSLCYCVYDYVIGASGLSELDEIGHTAD